MRKIKKLKKYQNLDKKSASPGSRVCGNSCYIYIYSLIAASVYVSLYIYVADLYKNAKC